MALPKPFHLTARITLAEHAKLLELAKRLPGYFGKPSMGDAIRWLINHHADCKCEPAPGLRKTG